MEHISKHLTVVSNQETMPSLNVQKDFLPEERQIVELKYKAPVFGKMEFVQLHKAAHVILIKLHIITGWNMPQAEYLDILLDQFEKKLIESYPNVNIEEMEYAFRNNPGVKDWGKAMNLNLIDEVMQPYLERRREISRMEESQKVKQIALPAPEVSDAEFIESVRNLYKIHQDFRQIPALAYKSLNLQLSAEKKEAIKTLVNAIIDEPTQDHYKQYACKVHFDNLK